MAVVTTKSVTIGNRDASPSVINDGRLERGGLRSSVGFVTVGAADSATSYFPLVSVPSNAMVRGIFATNPAGMTTLAVDIGVFKNTRDSGGALLGTAANTGSGTFFATAVSLAVANDKLNVTNESTTNTFILQNQPLWQAIGLTADPATTFDIGMKITTANTGAAGFAGIEVQYVDNGN